MISRTTTLSASAVALFAFAVFSPQGIMRMAAGETAAVLAQVADELDIDRTFYRAGKEVDDTGGSTQESASSSSESSEEFAPMEEFSSSSATSEESIFGLEVLSSSSAASAGAQTSSSTSEGEPMPEETHEAAEGNSILTALMGSMLPLAGAVVIGGGGAGYFLLKRRKAPVAVSDAATIAAIGTEEDQPVMEKSKRMEVVMSALHEEGIDGTKH